MGQPGDQPDSLRSQVIPKNVSLVTKTEVDSACSPVAENMQGPIALFFRGGENHPRSTPGGHMSENQPVRGSFIDGDDLRKEFFVRRKKEIRKSIPRGVKIPEGWVEKPTKYPKTMWIVRQKDVSQQLEDDVWCLFYKMGMEKLSTSDFTVHLRTVADSKIGSSKDETKQLDLVAVHGSNIFVVECKSKRELGGKRLPDVIREMDDNRNAYTRAFTEILGYKPRLSLILATRNIDVDIRDVAKAREKSISVWNTVDVDAFMELAESAGDGARYQLYNIVLRKRKARDKALRVPALKASMGGHTYYSMVLHPDHLLDIAYVHRRTGDSTVSDTRDAYQRMLEQGRVNNIKKFIEDEKAPGFFPGSIILCFDKQLRSEPLLDKKKRELLIDGANPVMLTLPSEYGSAWIIDGQHRLYGYANSNLKYSETLPVVAFADKDTSFQSKMFVDINKNQKSVDPNLLWDLYEDLYEKSEDLKECQDRTLSKIAKMLNAEDWSPFQGKIFVPKEGNKKAPLNIRAVCNTLRQKNVVHHDNGNLFCGDWDESVEYAARRVAIFYQVIRDAMPEQWESGERHFVCTKPGFITLTGIFADIVQENLPPIKLKSKKRYEIEVAELLKPLVRHLLEAPDALIDKYRAVGGAEGSTRALRAKFTEMMDIKSDFLKDFKEQDGQADLLDSYSVLPYLQHDEHDHLEFKGSLSLILDKYLATGGKEMSTEIAGEGVLRAVAGFLNGHGGQVVIGVLEKKCLMGAREDLAESCVEVNGKYLVGTQLEYPRDGADGYQRKIRNMIKERVGTYPLGAGLVDIRALEQYSGKDVWVVSVKPAGKRQYLDGEHFYVRMGNETVQLRGAAADEYWATRSS